MIAVGIDVSKAKSTVAILNGDGSIRAKPFDVHHVADELQALVDYIKRTSEPPTILMEPTSHYHYPLLKAFQEAELAACIGRLHRKDVRTSNHPYGTYQPLPLSTPESLSGSKSSSLSDQSLSNEEVW